ncbi:MAG: UxaA family hydrolase [Burkholderiaceae bacterium]
MAAQVVPGCLALTLGLTRGVRGADARLQQRVIEAILEHPNTGAVLAIAHDRVAAARLQALLATLGRPYRVLALMACDGYQAAIDSAATALHELSREAARMPRVPVGLGDLAWRSNAVGPMPAVPCARIRPSVDS